MRFFINIIRQVSIIIFKHIVKYTFLRIGGNHLLISYLRGKEFTLRVARHKFIQKQRLQKKATKNKKLHVVYLLGHVSVCGGVKVILEHANELIKQGVDVTLLSHFPQPDWFEITAKYNQIPFGIELARGIPSDSDVVVATYWDQLAACVEANIAPVVYFEQGDFHLWDWDKVTADQQSLIYKLYQLPSFIITCSETGAQKIRQVFHRESQVFHNALNEEVFFPKNIEPTNNIILGVGSEQASFKRIPDIWEACEIVRSKNYNINFTWVTQYPPKKPLGTVVVCPSQTELGNIYRTASIYVCASEYETFPLPPLEAMASGTPVITTPNDGVKAYGIDGVNCLFFEPGSINELAEMIIKLLEDSALYQELQQNGYQTAARFKWNEIIPKLKSFYQEVAQYQTVGMNKLNDWVKLIPEEYTPDEQKLINQFLEGTAADLVYLPFTFKISQELTLARWYPAFQRVFTLSNQVDFLYCSFKEKSLQDYPYNDALSSFLQGNYKQAIIQFKHHLEKATASPEIAVLIKWVAWCLIRLEKFPEAQKLLQKGYKTYPNYADIYYLYSLLFQQTGSLEELSAIQQTMKVLGEALGFPEFIIKH